ncbi:hypothetical protein L218DRAFT_323828 [Marasmius fiardii PR-910]|nr:hypothetical protein L218DRAFT_323828 [Marasmius fiardii PR-910]
MKALLPFRRTDDKLMSPRTRLSTRSMPAFLVEESFHVEDAIIVGDTVVVGYDRAPSQVTLLKLDAGSDDQIERSELPHKPHATSLTRFNASGRGISCLAPDVSGDSFCSGGYDRTIQHWSLETGSSDKITTLNAAPNSIACREKEILAGVGKTIEIFDIEHIHAKPRRFNLSNVIHHVHVHPTAKSISLVEVDHLDHQVLLYDCRKNNYGRHADCVLSHHSERKCSRYHRGSVLHSYFVRGYSDDTICLWDFRNPKVPIAKERHNAKAVHTTFTDAVIVAFGGEHVSFLDLDLNIL